MEHYYFLYSEEELKKYYDLLMPEVKNDEVFFFSLSARNKYLTKEERETLSLGRTEMFERRLLHTRDFEKLLRVVRKFEANKDGAYTTRSNCNIPEKCIIVYANLNPSSSLKAYTMYNKIYSEYLYELSHQAIHGSADKYQNILSRIKRADITLMNCFQKSRAKKYFIDVDFDIPKCDFKFVELFLRDLEKNDVTYYILDTKGGYHIVLDSSTIRYNFTEIIKELDSKVKELGNYEVVINKNEMVPLPGTLQGGHKVKLFKNIKDIV